MIPFPRFLLRLALYLSKASSLAILAKKALKTLGLVGGILSQVFK
jgi:hypothetical protein